MKLEAGLYKIQDQRSFGGSSYYLRVFYKDKQKWFQLNHYEPEKADDYGVIPLDGFKFVKKLQRPLDLRKARITIEWTDSDDDRFEVTMTNIQMLRRLFNAFPEVKEVTGANLKPGKRVN